MIDAVLANMNSCLLLSTKDNWNRKGEIIFKVINKPVI